MASIEKLRFRSGARRLAEELREVMEDDQLRAWVVPIEENYSALIIGTEEKAEFRRYVANTSLDEAEEYNVIVREEEPVYTPQVAIPIRVTQIGKGMVSEPTEPTTYVGYLLGRGGNGDYVPAEYELDIHKLAESLNAFRVSHGWSFSQAGNHAGVDYRSWSSMEKLSKPSGEVLMRVLMLLGVADYRTFMKRKEVPPQ